MAIDFDPTIFSVGDGWSTSFKSFVYVFSNGTLWLHEGGAGLVRYPALGAPQERDGSIMNSTTGGYTIEHQDGAVDTYTTAFTNQVGANLLFLTSRADSAGNTMTFAYVTNSGVLQLVRVTDADGRVTHTYYENGSFPNVITKVVDPFSRTNLLYYDTLGRLMNIVDPLGLSSSFGYDSGDYQGWITNMVTPYGTTGFRFGGVDATNILSYFDTDTNVSRFAEITLPTGGKHLYVYMGDCTNFLGSWAPTTPDTGPFATTFETGYWNTYYQGYFQANSFYWSPLQYVQLSTTNPTNLTSADYAKGRLRHWLESDDGPPAPALSIERAPSPDGATEGQVTWYDYENKENGTPFLTGDSDFPCFVAQVLPDGSTHFTYSLRGNHLNVTNEIETFTALDGSRAFRTNVFTYAANDIDLLLWTGPNGEQVVSNYFAPGNTIHKPDASYDALNQATLYTYNGHGQLTSIKSPTGLTTTNIYYSAGASINQLATNIDLEISRTNSYTWNNGLAATHTDPRGLVTANYWDNLLRLVSASYPDGSTISNVYTALDVTAHKDRLNQWSYFGFNGIRQMVAATNENGVVTRYGYCDCGALLSQTNAWSTPVQQVINFSYDYQGNLWKTAYPDAYCVTNWFDSLQRVTTTGDGTTYRYLYYNNQGLITNVSNSLGAERKTTFDIEDRSIYVTDINGVSVTNAFDDLNRLRTRVYPDGGVEKFGYSARGLIAYTNQLNLTNFFVYDEGSRKTFETNANGEIIRYTNSPAGDLLSLTDGKNQTTRWHYDEYGRVTNKVDQAGTEILRYGYDADSRLTNRWSAAKGNTAYTFDPVGNVTLINYPSSPDVTFKWDWLNRLTNMVDASGTNKYTYTAGNQLLTDDGPFASDTITNTYVNRLRTRLDLQQPTGLWTNLFAYDAARRLTNVISPAGAFGYQFVPSGVTHHASRITLPNSAYITNVYDGNARLTATYLKNSGNTTLDSYLYVYDPANERTNLTRADASTVAYAYDKIGQLKIADSSVNSEDRGYTYDAAWNLSYRTNNGVAAGFGVDSKNQLTSEGGFPCTYDSNGNLTQIGNSLSSIGIMVYSYDDENRLTEVYTNYNSPGQGPVTAAWQTDFVYDGLGRMRKRLDYAGGLLQGTTLYIYDGWRVIQERDGATGTPIASFTRGSDLSGSLEGAGGIGGLLARSDTYSGGNWGTHDYYFADGNGNITYLVDSSQSLAASYRYDPFGNVISSSGPLWALNRYRFSSKEIHVGSGMYYYGFRFYDPNLQRWINRDPLGDNESLKVRNGPSIAGEGVFGPRAYGFVYNNPVRYIDRNGLWGVAFGNDSGSSYFNVGVGSPSLYFSPDALHGLGESAAATADGLNPVGNPFANNGFYNPNDPNNRFSHGAGKIAQVCLTTAAGLGALKAANAALMPQTLYHFTSVEGAAGIAANGGIDATSGLYGYGTYLSGFNNAAMAALQGASATDVAVPVAAEGLSISATYFPGTYIVEGASVLVP